MYQFPKVNEVYASFFSEPFPVRTTVGVAALPKGGPGGDGRDGPPRPRLRLSDPLGMAPLTDTISLDEIRRARDVVADVARDTQVIESRYLSRTTGGTIALKAENLQRTGSFKVRGALNKIASPRCVGEGRRHRRARATTASRSPMPRGPAG